MLGMCLRDRPPAVRFLILELLAVAFWGLLIATGLATVRMAGELFIVSQAVFIAVIFGARNGAPRR